MLIKRLRSLCTLSCANYINNITIHRGLETANPEVTVLFGRGLLLETGTVSLALNLDQQTNFRFPVQRCDGTVSAVSDSITEQIHIDGCSFHDVNHL